MKKSRFLFFVLTFLLSISFISSVELTMNPSFDQSELIFVKVSGNFNKPLQQSNIFFYRNNVRLAAESDLVKIGGDYFIYSILSENLQGNYSIHLEDVEYYEGSKIIDQIIKQDFIITNETASFSLNKGFFISNNTFTIIIQNLLNKEISLELNLNSENTEDYFNLFDNSSEENSSKDYVFDLNSGEIKKIHFEVGSILEETVKYISLSAEQTRYTLPIILLANSKKPLDQEEVIDLNETIEEETNETIENETSEEKDELYIKQYCKDISGGNFCNATSDCDGEEVSAKDGTCCIGICVQESQSDSSSFQIIGWILIIIIVGVIGYLYFKKYSRTKNKVSFQNILKKKEKPAEPKKTKEEVKKDKRKKDLFFKH